MSEESKLFLTVFPVEHIRHFADLIHRSIPRVCEGSSFKKLPKYLNFDDADDKNAMYESTQNLKALLAIYDDYLQNGATYSRSTTWKCTTDAECVFVTNDVDGEITIVLARLALLNLHGALRLLGHDDFFTHTTLASKLLRAAIIFFVWASRRADHPKFDGYNADKCIFKKYHFLRAFSQISEALVYLLDLTYNCNFVTLASDDTLASAADAVKAASRAVVSSAGTSSDWIGESMSQFFTTVYTACDMLYQTLRGVQSFSEAGSDSEENAIIYISNLQSEAQKLHMKNTEAEIVKVVEWLLRVKRKTLGIFDAFKKLLEDASPKFKLVASAESARPTTTDVYKAVNEWMPPSKNNSNNNDVQVVADGDNNHASESINNTCSICNTEIAQTDGYMHNVDAGKSAHLLCFCLQTIVTRGKARVKNESTNDSNERGDVASYIKFAASVRVSFPSCRHGQLPLNMLLVAGDRKRLFYCDECTATPSVIEAVITEWTAQGDTVHSEPLKITESKTRVKQDTMYALLVDAFDQNASPAYIKRAYDSGDFGYEYTVKLSPIKDLCINQPDTDVVTLLTMRGYTVSEMVSMGLNYEMAISWKSSRSLIMQRNIATAPVLASLSFQFTVAKMLLAGVTLSEIADAGYHLNELTTLKLTARVFISGGGDEATLRKFLRLTEDFLLSDLMENEEDYDTPTQQSTRAWLVRAHFTPDIILALQK